MDAADLTPPQKRAMAVLVAATSGDGDRRPVRTSNRSTTDMRGREMLTVHHAVAVQLEGLGLVRVTNAWIGLLELTDTGRALVREAGLL